MPVTPRQPERHGRGNAEAEHRDAQQQQALLGDDADQVVLGHERRDGQLAVGAERVGLHFGPPRLAPAVEGEEIPLAGREGKERLRGGLDRRHPEFIRSLQDRRLPDLRVLEERQAREPDHAVVRGEHEGKAVWTDIETPGEVGEVAERQVVRQHVAPTARIVCVHHRRHPGLTGGEEAVDVRPVHRAGSGGLRPLLDRHAVPVPGARVVALVLARVLDGPLAQQGGLVAPLGELDPVPPAVGPDETVAPAVREAQQHVPPTFGIPHVDRRDLRDLRDQRHEDPVQSGRVVEVEDAGSGQLRCDHERALHRTGEALELAPDGIERAADQRRRRGLGDAPPGVEGRGQDRAGQQDDQQAEIADQAPADRDAARGSRRFAHGCDRWRSSVRSSHRRTSASPGSRSSRATASCRWPARARA